MAISKRLILWRKHFGLTQSNLEKLAGLGHNTVSRIECEQTNPGLDTVGKLARALKISTEQLLHSIPPTHSDSETHYSYKKRMQKDIEYLSEDECKDLYSVWEKLVEYSKKQKEI
jgi:transcriptional regulator with XRE-family HTH domain